MTPQDPTSTDKEPTMTHYPSTDKEPTMTHYPSIDRTRRPVAVYGTLRPGQGNDRLWHGVLDADPDPVVVPGYALHDGGGFPAAVADPERSLVASVLRAGPDVPDDAWHAVLARLDRLEGYPGWYDRVTVSTATGEEVWMYAMTDPANVARWSALPLVPDGDWCAGGTRWIVR